MHSVKWGFLLFLWFIYSVASAQKKEPLLEREISISASNETASSILTQIASQTGIKFSYSPTLIPADKKVTFKVTKKPLRTILQLMFADAVLFKEKGNFIILTAKPQPSPQLAIKEITISGYVYDENGEKIAFASIINRKEQTAAVTNQYGFYSIKVTVNQLPFDLKVLKENYHDTSIKINQKQKQVDVVLTREYNPPAAKAALISDSVAPAADTAVIAVNAVKQDSAYSETLNRFRKAINKLALTDEDKANIRNFKDTLFSSVQFGIIPQLSTNKLLVGNTINDASLSLLLGYSKGINIASFSGLMNYTAGDVKYAQTAGLGNVTEGNILGGQAAGLFNITDGALVGGQAAGLLNIIDSNVTGGQAAGLMNITKGNVVGGQAAGMMNIVEGDVTGAQAAGLLNIIEGNTLGANAGGFGNIVQGNCEGAQVAGVINVVEGNVNGLSLAGLSNIIEGDVKGMQLSGIGNVAKGNVQGIQLAGLFNTCDSTVKGLQFTSVINDARKVEGMQFGLINFAEENEGVSFGLFSFATRGYHKLEIFGDDACYTNLAFRTGVQRFHNIFIAGADLTSRVSGLWNFGYGFGSYHNLGNKWKIGGDITAQLYLKGGAISKAPQVNNIFIGVERTFSQKFSVTLGPIYHIMTNYSGDTEVADFIAPYSFYTNTFTDGFSLKMWAGGKISLKFF